jgi:muconolactone delta-isomerase
MPLRVWRTDEVTPLSPHPNDPAGETEQAATPTQGAAGSDFLTAFTVTVPAGTPDEDVDATTAREADRARQLAEEGHLLRLWTLPGQGRALGLYRALDTTEMEAILASLPLYAWLSLQTTPLAPHPSDPARTSG